jgi:VanZ family protein
MGHFGAFLVLGIFGSLTYYIIFKKSLKGKLIAFLTCAVAGFAVAGITEILQLPLFTYGRYCSFSDVLLDFVGYCTSTVPMYIIIILLHIIGMLITRLKSGKKVN